MTPSTATATQKRQRTHIRCTDNFERERSVGVWVAPNAARVVLVAPPGEVALLTPAQARQLRDRLDQVSALVEDRVAELRVVHGVERGHGEPSRDVAAIDTTANSAGSLRLVQS